MKLDKFDEIQESFAAIRSFSIFAESKLGRYLVNQCKSLPQRTKFETPADDVISVLEEKNNIS